MISQENLMNPMITALVLAAPSSRAFHWVQTRLRRRPESDMPQLIAFSVRVFVLSPVEAQWLTWNLESPLAALVPQSLSIGAHAK